MKYSICIEERALHVREVEANSEQEAMDKVEYHFMTTAMEPDGYETTVISRDISAMKKEECS